jgi:phage replication-related protein YjqB (UPF0714/DUF867 family)
MADIYHNYKELQKDFVRGKDFSILHKYRNNSTIIFTPHGGGIELGTSEIVLGIAGNNITYYIFDAHIPSTNRRNSHTNRDLHIKSTLFDEPICLGMVQKCQTAVAIHGCDKTSEKILIGGNNVQLRQKIRTELENAKFEVQDACTSMAGSDPDNICNKTSNHAGVQLEITQGLREKLFNDLNKRAGRKITTGTYQNFVEAIRTAIFSLQGSLLNHAEE